MLPRRFVMVDCAEWSRGALLAPAFLSRLGLRPRPKVIDLKVGVRCRENDLRGRLLISKKWQFLE